jgi:SAM-dependent methyltransferase
MPRWDHGYVTDTVYTNNFQREITPVWLAAVALLVGQKPPDLSQPFRYADLGCGNGLTSLVIAATCAHAEVWGFDFNPAHIEFARTMADRAGLRNIHFVECSFADLASAGGPRGDALPAEFDFMIAHGILSWISADNQRHLISAINQRLRPGGLAYVSYNVPTGTGDMVPLRSMMRIMTEGGAERSDQAALGALNIIDRMLQGGALYFQRYPGLEQRLRELRAQDPRYIAHEYLNQDWHPMMFAEVADAMAEAKCTFIGSATLTDNIETTSVPQGVAPLMAETTDRRLRETIRDIASAQGFRRDLFRRGSAAFLPSEHRAHIMALSFEWTGKEAGDQFTFATSVGAVTGRQELYGPVLERISLGALSVAELSSLPEFADLGIAGLLETLTMLTTGGYLHPLLPQTVRTKSCHSAEMLNRVLIEMNLSGSELARLAVPAMGSSLPSDLLEMSVIGSLLDGVPSDPGHLAQVTLQRLATTGRGMQHDGKQVTDPAEALKLATDVVTQILATRAALHRRLGILPS